MAGIATCWVCMGQWSGTRNDGVRINDGNRDMINDAKGDYPANACD